MQFIVNFLVKAILYVISFIICAWFFLGISPVETWKRSSARVTSLYKATETTVKSTTEDAATLPDRTIEHANQRISELTKITPDQEDGKSTPAE